MSLSKRPKTWSASDESPASSDHERSNAGSQQVVGAQQEVENQAMLYEAQIHEVRKVR